MMNSITLKLSYEELTALNDLLFSIIQPTERSNDLSKLIQAIVTELHFKLHQRSFFAKKKNNIKLTIAQGIALKMSLPVINKEVPVYHQNVRVSVLSIICQKLA